VRPEDLGKFKNPPHRIIKKNGASHGSKSERLTNLQLRDVKKPLARYRLFGGSVLRLSSVGLIRINKFYPLRTSTK
jgi:hypothetical protein